MRPLHPKHLRMATRGTTRAINRGVVLNLIRINQPISRADLARLMGTRRGAVSVLVNQLIEDGAVFEGATGEAKRGRKPTFLYMDSRERCVVAVDIRPTRTFVMVTISSAGNSPASPATRPNAIRSASSPASPNASMHPGRAPRSGAAAKASVWWCRAWSTPRVAESSRRLIWVGATSR